MGLGVDFEGLDPVEIRSILLSASSTVDDFCAVPQQPQPYSFRGGAITDEAHSWSPGGLHEAPQTAFYLRHKPIREVTSIAIHVTNLHYITINPDDLFIWPDLGKIEVVSLSISPYSLVGGGLSPILGLRFPQARISYTYGYEYPVTDERLEPTDARTYQAANQFWSTADVEVKVDGVVSDPDDYEIDREEGEITFDSAQSAEARVTASYSYTLPASIAQATGLIAADNMNKSDLVAKGMGSLSRLRVGEIEMARGLGVGGQRNSTVPSVPDDAAIKLADYVFVTAR